MKITVLDKCTLTVGDIDFSPIEALGEVSYYDILPHDEIIEAAKDCEVLLCNKAVIDADIMDSCKNLKYIGLFATGYNNISTDEAKKRGIIVVNVPGYSTYSVAQLTMAFILSHATSLHDYNESTHSGEWIKSYAFSYFPYPITELYGKTLGVYGMGAIGRKVAECAKVLGMNVIACILFAHAVGNQSFLNQIIIEDCGMRAAVGKDLAGGGKIPLVHPLGVTKTDGGINQPYIVNHTHKHLGQLVCNDISFPISSSHHITA